MVLKLVGKHVSFITMRDRLWVVWKISGAMDVVDIGYGLYMVKFDVSADREKVISGGPWMIFDHYLAVRPWKPDFITSEIKVDST